MIIAVVLTTHQLSVLDVCSPTIRAIHFSVYYHHEIYKNTHEICYYPRQSVCLSVSLTHVLLKLENLTQGSSLEINTRGCFSERIDTSFRQCHLLLVEYFSHVY